MTNKKKDSLTDRKHLEKHEIDMLDALLQSYLSSAFERKHKLKPDENRLFGQLAVVAFSKFPVGKPLSLLNFPRRRPFLISQLPVQYKQGQETHSKNLFKRRIRNGEAWMGHLRGFFNDELIAKMFLKIADEELVRKTVRKYHNHQLRLTAEDAAALKSYAGLTDNAYVKINRCLFHLRGLRILAPLQDVKRLRRRRKEEDYQSMSRSVVDMTRQLKKGGATISRQIKVGVITIRPKECILNSAGKLLKHDALVPSADQFRCPGIKPGNIKDVVLFKFAGDKGGGSFKLIVNPVNVERPQSLRHVQPVCEFTAPDTRSNLRAAFFHDGNRCKEDMEDILHRRCVLLHLKLGGQSEVAIVKNINPRHHRMKPDSLPKEYRVRRYLPIPEAGPPRITKFADRVTEVEFKLVKSILLMVNGVQKS